MPTSPWSVPTPPPTLGQYTQPALDFWSQPQLPLQGGWQQMQLFDDALGKPWIPEFHPGYPTQSFQLPLPFDAPTPAPNMFARPNWMQATMQWPGPAPDMFARPPASSAMPGPNLPTPPSPASYNTWFSQQMAAAKGQPWYGGPGNPPPAPPRPAIGPGSVGSAAGGSVDDVLGAAGSTADDAGRAWASAADDAFVGAAGAARNWNPWASTLGRLPGMGATTGVRGFLAGGALSAGVGAAINFAGDKLQGTDTQSAWDNMVETAAGGGSLGASMGPWGALIGAGGGAVGQGVTELTRALTGNQGRPGSAGDILANSEIPVATQLGGLLGGDKSTGLKWSEAAGANTNGKAPAPPPTNLDLIQTAAKDMGLDSQATGNLTMRYNDALALNRVMYQSNPAGFEAAWREQHPDAPDDAFNPDSLLEQMALDDVLQNYLPYAKDAQLKQQHDLQRASAYQAMMSQYLNPISARYDELAAQSTNPNTAAAMSAMGLANERAARAYPVYSAAMEQQSYLNQIAQQQWQSAYQAMMNPASTTDQTDPFAIQDEAILNMGG